MPIYVTGPDGLVRDKEHPEDPGMTNAEFAAMCWAHVFRRQMDRQYDRAMEALTGGRSR